MSSKHKKSYLYYESSWIIFIDASSKISFSFVAKKSKCVGKWQKSDERQMPRDISYDINRKTSKRTKYIVFNTVIA